MKGREFKTICMTNSNGGTVVSWAAPKAMAIVEVSLCVSGASGTAGADAAGAYLLTQADSSAVPGDTASENVLAYVPAVALVNGTAVFNSISAKVFRVVRPGQSIWLRNDAFAIGSLVGVAVITLMALE